MRRAALFALVLAGCASEAAQERDLTEPFGPRMRPGENCLGCHTETPVRSDAVGPSGRKAPTFSAAGTVYTGPTSNQGQQGVEVVFQDLAGAEFSVRSNEVGNFWTTRPIDTKVGPKVRFAGRTAEMKYELPTIPACNACHSNPPLDVGREGPLDDPPGRIYVP
jgi:hypothetical protein